MLRIVILCLILIPSSTQGAGFTQAIVEMAATDVKGEIRGLEEVVGVKKLTLRQAIAQSSFCIRILIFFLLLCIGGTITGVLFATVFKPSSEGMDSIIGSSMNTTVMPLNLTYTNVSNTTPMTTTTTMTTTTNTPAPTANPCPPLILIPAVNGMCLLCQDPNSGTYCDPNYNTDGGSCFSTGGNPASNCF